jgi:hypothetical protein
MEPGWMAERLRQLSLGEALGLADEEERGRDRARCLSEQLAEQGRLWLWQLDQSTFLRIAWQEDDSTRLITASAKNRTLGAIADYVFETFGSLDGPLASEPVPRQFQPGAFQRCVDIASSFDLSRWKRPWLVPATGSELRNTPATRFYVCEGVHRTMALALGLKQGSIIWAPIEAIVADDRVPECC